MVSFPSRSPWMVAALLIKRQVRSWKDRHRTLATTPRSAKEPTSLLDVSEPGATYLWDDGSTSASRTVATDAIYWVEVTRNGCTQRDSVAISLFSPSSLDLGGDRLVCAGSHHGHRCHLAGCDVSLEHRCHNRHDHTGTAGSIYRYRHRVRMYRPRWPPSGGPGIGQRRIFGPDITGLRR